MRNRRGIRHLVIATSAFAIVLVFGTAAIMMAIPFSATARLIVIVFVPVVLAASIAVVLMKDGTPREIELVPDGIVATFFGFRRTFRAKDFESMRISRDPASAALVFNMRDNRVTGLSDMEEGIADAVLDHLRKLGVSEHPEADILRRRH